MSGEITGRGGAGRGQGRKPVLATPDERRRLAIKCDEVRERIAAKQKHRAAVRAGGDTELWKDLRKQQKKMMALQARAVRLARENERAAKRAEARGEAPPQARRDKSLETDQKRLSARVASLLRARNLAPVRSVGRGFRDLAFEITSLQENIEIERWNRTHPTNPRKRITPRLVESCWKDWRKTWRPHYPRLKAELANYVPDPNNAALDSEITPFERRRNSRPRQKGQN